MENYKYLIISKRCRNSLANFTERLRFVLQQIAIFQIAANLTKTENLSSMTISVIKSTERMILFPILFSNFYIKNKNSIQIIIWKTEFQRFHSIHENVELPYKSNFRDVRLVRRKLLSDQRQD